MVILILHLQFPNFMGFWKFLGFSLTRWSVNWIFRKLVDLLIELHYSLVRWILTWRLLECTFWCMITQNNSILVRVILLLPENLKTAVLFWLYISPVDAFLMLGKIGTTSDVKGTKIDTAVLYALEVVLCSGRKKQLSDTFLDNFTCSCCLSLYEGNDNLKLLLTYDYRNLFPSTMHPENQYIWKFAIEVGYEKSLQLKWDMKFCCLVLGCRCCDWVHWRSGGNLSWVAVFGWFPWSNYSFYNTICSPLIWVYVLAFRTF